MGTACSACPLAAPLQDPQQTEQARRTKIVAGAVGAPQIAVLVLSLELRQVQHARRGKWPEIGPCTGHEGRRSS